MLAFHFLCLSTRRGKTVHLHMIMLFPYLHLPLFKRRAQVDAGVLSLSLAPEESKWTALPASLGWWDAEVVHQHRAVFQQLGTGVKGVLLNISLNNMPEISSWLSMSVAQLLCFCALCSSYPVRSGSF